MKDTTFQLMELLRDSLGADELLKEITLYMSKEEADEMYEHIASLWDIEGIDYNA